MIIPNDARIAQMKRITSPKINSFRESPNQKGIVSEDVERMLDKYMKKDEAADKALDNEIKNQIINNLKNMLASYEQIIVGQAKIINALRDELEAYKNLKKILDKDES